MKLQLANITIICVDGVNPTNGLKAIKYSMKDIDFAHAKLISHIKPNNIPDNIAFHLIEPLTSVTYNKWMIHELYRYVDTDFVLTIHDDGFVINPHLWNDNFLNYDYIGAPWKNYGQTNRVGNGGFSLRSKKLVNLCRNMTADRGHEDGIICIYNKEWLESQNCTFAPVEVAMKFSLESRIPECNFDLNNTFGFHGRGHPENSFSEHDGFYQQFQDRVSLLNNII